MDGWSMLMQGFLEDFDYMETLGLTMLSILSGFL